MHLRPVRRDRAGHRYHAMGGPKRFLRGGACGFNGEEVRPVGPRCLQQSVAFLPGLFLPVALLSPRIPGVELRS